MLAGARAVWLLLIHACPTTAPLLLPASGGCQIWVVGGMDLGVIGIRGLAVVTGACMLQFMAGGNVSATGTHNLQSWHDEECLRSLSA